PYDARVSGAELGEPGGVTPPGYPTIVSPRPLTIGSDACVRSSACTEDFSSAHNTIAFSGGFRYRPTTSTSFSSNFGSPDTLNVSTRCGLRANSFHTRCTVLFETPATPAIVLVLQCVSPCGRYSSDAGTIRSSVASGIEGLRHRPSRTCPNLTRPSPANRVRQFATVAGDTDTAAAIVAFATPSAPISKALARTTSRCAADCDRANDSNTSRCPSVIANAGTGLLIPEIIPIHYQLFGGQTTSKSLAAYQEFCPPGAVYPRFAGQRSGFELGEHLLGGHRGVAQRFGDL